MDLISIIVPVYKVEKYLDKCIESIVNQTYKNLEIILVDDGSPDNCGVMCDAWAEKDSRIKVIHKENGGLSDARNAGMEIATGKYIGFVDSDDCIAPEMYELLHGRIVADGSDIAACGVEMVWEDGTESRMLTRQGDCVLDTCAAMEAVIDESWLKQPVWYKLYKTDLVRDIRFPVGKYHEDVFWTWRAVARAAKVSVFDTPCYFYLQRSSSIMGEKYSLKRLDGLEAKCLRHREIAEKIPELSVQTLSSIWYACLYHGQCALRDLQAQERKAVMDKLKEVQRAYPLPEKRPDELSVKYWTWFRLSGVCLQMVCQIRNWMKLGL